MISVPPFGTAPPSSAAARRVGALVVAGTRSYRQQNERDQHSEELAAATLSSHRTLPPGWGCRRRCRTASTMERQPRTCDNGHRVCGRTVPTPSRTSRGSGRALTELQRKRNTTDGRRRVEHFDQASAGSADRIVNRPILTSRWYWAMRANSSGVEAGAADQRAVDVGLGHEVGDVLRLHRAAVLDPHRRRDLGVEQRRHRRLARASTRPGRRRASPSGRCRWPRSARRRSPSPPPARAFSPARPAATCPSTLASVAPASRSSSVSPTHMIGVISWRRIAFTLRLTASSVSPNSSRRSEWPAIT